MESFILTSSRQLQHLCRSSTRTVTAAQPAYREYSTSSICSSCRTGAQKKALSSSTQRRWISQATVASGRPRKETPLQPAKAPKNHYDFFPQTASSGPPPSGSFVINPRELRREFLQLQAVAHPDRHPQELKSRAEATSARINEAYKTLQNPLLRAQYLLLLRGIDVAEDETAKVEDPELLMEVLETREQIESAEDERELYELRRVNDERIHASEKVLEEAFRVDDLVTAKDEAVRLRYWINIKESLDAWEKGKPVVLVH